MIEPRRHEPVPEQRAAIDDRERDLFLFAGAGSGKTTVLVERFCDAVCAGSGPDAEVGVENVLAFTFTEKAAGEMKRRIRAELRRRAAAEEGESPERARLLRSYARESDSAWISTIHAFCQRVLAAHPLAAGIDPRFRVLDESAAGRVALESFDAAFERFGGEPGSDRFEMAAAFRLEQLREIVVAAHDGLRSRGEANPELPQLDPPDVEGAVAELRSAAGAALAATAEESGAAPDRYRACMALAQTLTDGRVPSERELADCVFSSGAAGFAGPEVKRFHEARGALEARIVERDFLHHYDYLRELLRLFAAEYAGRKAARAALDFEDLQLVLRRLLEERPDLRRRYQRQFSHVMVDELQDTNLLQLAIVRLLHLEAGEAQNRLFTVGDEFQSIYSFRNADVEVFRAERRRMEEAELARAGVSAEPLSYPNGVPAGLPDGGVRELLGNFRARPELLAVVNQLGRALLPGYRELTVGAPPEAPAPRAAGPAVEVLVTEAEGWEAEGLLPGVSADEQAQPWRLAEARFLARRLRELADEGFPRGDMVVLLRAFTYVEAYESELEREGLAPYVVGGRGYWSKQQVQDIRHLLGALLNPLDELALLGTLASPCCSVTPDTLWLLRRAAGGRTLWSVVRRLYGPSRDVAEENEADGSGEDDTAEWAQHVPAADAEALRRFVEVFLALRDQAPRLALDELIDRAVTDTGYDLALLMRSGGRRRMANVRKLMRLAREFEQEEGRDLRGFLAFVDSEREIRAREGEAALHAEAHDGVRVMTVHGAKGLEFPLVAVADLGRGLGAGFPPALRLHPGGTETEPEPSAMRVGLRLARLGRKGKRLFAYEDLQREAEELMRDEERRIFHVAMTRAQERLILSGACRRGKLGDEPRPSTPLMQAILPVLGSDGSEGVVRVGPPDPREGLDVSFAPADVAIRLNAPPAEGEQIALGPAEPFEPAAPAPLRPLPHPDLEPLAADAAAPVTRVSYSALSLYGRCGYRFYAERVLGMRPLRVGLQDLTPAGADDTGELGVEPPADEVPALPVGEDGLLTREEAEGLGQRYARGIVVHELLERSARDGWTPPDPELAGRLLEREGVSAGAAEVERVCRLVGGFLDSPLRAELADARLHPEAPFLFRLGALAVRGEIDLLTDTGDEVVVVDYKSDRLEGSDPGERMDRYEVQRRIYALAALRRYGRPVRVAYVFLERPDEPVEERFAVDAVESLTAELAALTEGIEAGRFEVTQAPGRDLCFDCPARRRLCVHPPERTLAERPR